MTRPQMLPMSKKITKDDIQDKTRKKRKDENEERYEKNIHFGKTFMILDQMGVFPRERNVVETTIHDKDGKQLIEKRKIRLTPLQAPIVVVNFLYDCPEADIFAFTNAELQEYRKLDDVDCFFGRLHRLRHDGAIFLDKEAEFFHTAFRYAFGDEWADAISKYRLANEDISEIIAELYQNRLPIAWHEFNPVQVLRILDVNQDKEKPKLDIRLQPYKGEKLVRQEPGEPRKLRSISDATEMSVGDEFRLRIQGLSSNQSFLILNFADHVLNDDQENVAYQVQIMRHFHRDEDKKYVFITGRDREALEVEPVKGNFGFCIISCYDNFDFTEFFNLPKDRDMLTVEEFQNMIETLREKMIDASDFGIDLVDYTVMN